MASANCPEGPTMSHHAPAIDAHQAEGLSGTHLRALEKVFQHPLTHNLTWREVNKLFGTIGTVEHRHNGDRVLHLGEQELVLPSENGKDLEATEVMDVRHLLIRAGWAAKTIDPVTDAVPVIPDVMIVVDHSGARLYALHPENLTMAAEETHHLRHEHINRKRHDADRDERDPSDTRFFEAVAAALPSKGRIVVISHGKGQSNEAAHLIAYLGRHHDDIDCRIVGDIVADLPHLTVPQMVQLARDALGTAPVCGAD
jgi:hypothetical protein